MLIHPLALSKESCGHCQGHGERAPAVMYLNQEKALLGEVTVKVISSLIALCWTTLL